jgi:hypothetical protein
MRGSMTDLKPNDFNRCARVSCAGAASRKRVSSSERLSIDHGSGTSVTGQSEMRDAKSSHRLVKPCVFPISRFDP